MFCLPVPIRDRIYPKPIALITIAILDGLLLLPVLGGNQRQLYTLAAFVPAHATLLGFFGGMFLHGGVWHYAGNMWFLWIFGRKIEARTGPFVFTLIYLACGVCGQLLYWLCNPHSPVPLVGASGAISGIAGVYFVAFPQDAFNLHIYLGWFKVKTWATTARSAVGAWFLEQFVLGILTGFVHLSSIAFMAHVGGFLGGTAFAYLLGAPKVDHTALPEVEGDLSEDRDLLEDNEAEPSDLTTLKLS